MELSDVIAAAPEHEPNRKPACAVMVWLRLQEVAQHLELTTHGRLIPAVALIAVR